MIKLVIYIQEKNKNNCYWIESFRLTEYTAPLIPDTLIPILFIMNKFDTANSQKLFVILKI